MKIFTIKRFASHKVPVYLLKNVKSLGVVGEIVTVKPGYARNYLIPQGMGIYVGEGEFEKVLPILHTRETVENSKSLTKAEIKEELNRLLNNVPIVSFCY
jgi:large subunit ribosomal protein L9